MTALVALAALAATGTPHLVAYWSGNGTLMDEVSHVPAKGMGGLVFVDGPFGKAFDFDGENSVIFVPDSNRFKLTDGLTLSCWIYLKAKPKYGSSPQAQIIFRGDDRPGLDPYQLRVSADMKWEFGIQDAQNRLAMVSSPAELNAWTHLCGTWDGQTGIERLYVDGDLVAEEKTDIRPMKELDIHYSPGISIGNVQNPYGPDHYQPLNASLAEVKIYDGALDKSDYVKPKS